MKMCSQSQDPNEYRYKSEFYLSNYYDYEQGSAEHIVKGRMKTNIAFGNRLVHQKIFYR